MTSWRVINNQIIFHNNCGSGLGEFASLHLKVQWDVVTIKVECNTVWRRTDVMASQINGDPFVCSHQRFFVARYFKWLYSDWFFYFTSINIPLSVRISIGEVPHTFLQFCYGKWWAQQLEKKCFNCVTHSATFGYVPHLRMNRHHASTAPILTVCTENIVIMSWWGCCVLTLAWSWDHEILDQVCMKLLLFWIMFSKTHVIRTILFNSSLDLTSFIFHKAAHYIINVTGIVIVVKTIKTYMIEIEYLTM